MKNLKILLVSENPGEREILKIALKSEKAFSVCTEASSADEAIYMIKNIFPDIIIVDKLLKGNINGIDFVKNIKKSNPKILSIIYSEYNDYFVQESALRAGANGYLGKSALNKKIVDALKIILKGELFFDEKIFKKETQKILYNYDNLNL
jgi:DNA-binding NarL/FixJ family response regulator